MIRLSRLADYGMLLMGQIAARPRTLSALDLAEDTHLPLPTVSKILTTLARADLLVSHRGVKGGYALARDAREISAADIVGALDGPVALTQCIEHGPGVCDLEMLCPSRTGWKRINEAIRKALAEVSLAEMAGPTALPPAALTPAASPGKEMAGKEMEGTS